MMGGRWSLPGPILTLHILLRNIWEKNDKRPKEIVVELDNGMKLNRK